MYRYVNKDGRGKMDDNSRVQILDTGLPPSAIDPARFTSLMRLMLHDAQAGMPYLWLRMRDACADH